MDPAVEKHVALPHHSVGSAADRIVELSAEMEYRTTPLAPRKYQLVRQRRGRLFRKYTQTMMIQLVEDRAGTRAMITGDVDELFVDHLLDAKSESSVPVSESIDHGQPSTVLNPPRVPRLEVPVRPAAPPGDMISMVPGASPPSTPAQDEPGVVSDQVDRVGGDVGPSEQTVAKPPRTLGAVDPLVAQRTPDISSGGGEDGLMIVGSPTSRRAQLVFADGRQVEFRGVVVIGRKPDASQVSGNAVSLAIDDPSVSKTHVTLERRDDQIMIVDLYSTNGCRVECGGDQHSCEPGVALTLPLGPCTVWAGRAAIEVRVS